MGEWKWLSVHVANSWNNFIEQHIVHACKIRATERHAHLHTTLYDLRPLIVHAQTHAQAEVS